MTDQPSFSGFTKETVRFYAALRKNNDRAWFEANRATYESHVVAPPPALRQGHGEKLKTIVPQVIAIPAVNKSIFRIYRDTRFSLDPAPYKTNLGIYFWDGRRSGWNPRDSILVSSRPNSISAAACT